MTIGPILLVEDNEDDIFALKRTLRKAGITCLLRITSDGKQAIDYLQGQGEFCDRRDNPLPDVVLLDLKIPYVSGLEVLAWIRSRPGISSLPVIVLSGSNEERDHKRATELGASGYLVKPASPADIQALLTSL